MAKKDKKATKETATVDPRIAAIDAELADLQAKKEGMLSYLNTKGSIGRKDKRAFESLKKRAFKRTNELKQLKGSILRGGTK